MVVDQRRKDVKLPFLVIIVEAIHIVLVIVEKKKLEMDFLLLLVLYVVQKDTWLLNVILISKVCIQTVVDVVYVATINI